MADAPAIPERFTLHHTILNPSGFSSGEPGFFCPTLRQNRKTANAEPLRLYLTAIVLRELIHLGMTTRVILIGIATIVYTFFGGMRSVVWNDCIQFVVYMLGAAWALYVLVGDVPGGSGSIVEYGTAHHKFRVFDFNPDPRSDAYTFWIALIGGCFLTLATHGTDQLTVQRLS